MMTSPFIRGAVPVTSGIKEHAERKEIKMPPHPRNRGTGRVAITGWGVQLRLGGHACLERRTGLASPIRWWEAYWNRTVRPGTQTGWSHELSSSPRDPRARGMIRLVAR